MSGEEIGAYLHAVAVFDEAAIIPPVTVFVAMFALDFVWAFYTKAIQHGQSLRGAGYAAVLICLAGTAQIGYTHDPWLLIPAALGAAGGTYAALRCLGRVN